MIRGMFRLIGNLALLAAAGAFITGISLFVAGSFLLSWPLMRMSPRERKLRAVMDLAAATLALAQALAGDRPLPGQEIVEADA